MSARVESQADLRALVAAVVREQLGAEVAGLEPLEAALGRRLFARVWLRPASAPSPLPSSLIARVERPEDPERRPAGIPAEPALEPIRALLEAEGLPVPARHGGDATRGVELLEDLGPVALSDVAGTLPPSELDALYREACDLIPRLQRITARADVAAFARRLDDAQFAYKAERFARFGLHPAGAARAAETRVLFDSFMCIAREARFAPQRLAHRDLQSANLQLVERPGQRPGARLVMIDLQGAFMAPPEYDLVCLLRDSYVALEDQQLEALLGRIRPQLPDAPDESSFRHRFDLLTLSRKAKDCALYRYAAVELGDRRYLRFLPTTHRYLRAASSRVAASDPRFRDLDELIQAQPEPSCAP